MSAGDAATITVASIRDMISRGARALRHFHDDRFGDAGATRDIDALDATVTDFSRAMRMACRAVYTACDDAGAPVSYHYAIS